MVLSDYISEGKFQEMDGLAGLEVRFNTAFDIQIVFISVLYSECNNLQLLLVNRLIITGEQSYELPKICFFLEC